jgi:hypothetical protein
MINNIKHLALLLVIIITTSSCNNKKNLQSVTLYDINKVSDIVRIPLDSIAMSTEIIQLDSSIGYMTDLIETEDYYFAIWRSEQISQYNKNGKFIRNIYCKGRGPGEYIAASGLYYNEVDSTLYTFDFAQQKIITYKDGQYIESGDVLLNEHDVFLSSFYPYESNLIFYTSSNKNNPFLVMYNTKSKESVQITEKSEMIKDDSLLNDGAHFFFNDNPTYYSLLNDTVFSILNNKLRADFLIKNFSTPNPSQISIICLRSLGDNLFIHYFHINQENKRTRHIGLYNQKSGEYNQDIEVTSLNPQTAIKPNSRLIYSNGKILIKVNYEENSTYLVKYSVQ